MLFAFLFAASVSSAGFGVLGALGLGKGPAALGLAAPTGLSVLVVVTTWCVLLGAPPPAAGVAALLLVALGLGLLVRERQGMLHAARRLASEDPIAAWLMLACVVVPVVVFAYGLAGVQAPLSPHDGAFHTEVIQMDRTGATTIGWYPPGLAALFAAWLQLFNRVDTAQGSFELGAGLALLVGPTGLGLGAAVWRNLRMAGVGSICLSLTYLFPGFPQIWSGWPLTLSVIVTLGVWILMLQYLAWPTPRWAVVAGLAVGAIVLAHGTELYTLAIIGVILVVGGRGTLPWRRVPWVLALAGLIAIVSAAPYLPTLLHWAAGGGAYAVGIEDSQVPATSAESSPTATFVIFALGALGVDLPIRVILVCIGVAWAVRAREGRTVLAVGLVFGALAVLFKFGRGAPLVTQVFALLFPWPLEYRLLIVDVVAQALLAGVGGVVAVSFADTWLASRERWPARTVRLGRRALRLLVLTWLIVATWAMAIFLAYPAGVVNGYSLDDAGAMAWLRANVPPGVVVANDTYADAGIWIPYKAGLPIVLPRIVADNEQARRMLVIENISRLDAVPEARAAACALHVAYVYRGAQNSGWQARVFPSLEELRASPGLEEVFASGEAVVFRTRLSCPA